MVLTKDINFGVLVYQNECTQYSSINVGDYIQSLASLNIYRKIIEKLTNNKYKFSDFLDLVLNNSIKNFNFIFIKRDCMHDIKQYEKHTNIITIMNGWWMWPCKNNGDISFIIPPNIESLKNRLLHRNQDKKKSVEQRMSKFKEEISHWNEYNYVVVNDNLENCYNRILKIIYLEKKGIQEIQNRNEIKLKIEKLLK